MRGTKVEIVINSKGGNLIRRSFILTTVLLLSISLILNTYGTGKTKEPEINLKFDIFLAAQSLQLGSCYINQLHWLRDDPSVRAYLLELGIPKEHTICSAAAIGFVNKLRGDFPLSLLCFG